MSNSQTIKFVCFDLLAPFGTFRVPEGNRAYLTFPLPPRTTILGLIAGILGIPHNDYYVKDHPLRNAILSIQTISDPAKNLSMKGNFINTKKVQSFRVERTNYLFFVPDLEASDRGLTTQNNYLYLQNLHYRIYFSADSEILTDFENRVKTRHFHYTPTAGLANLLADVKYIGSFNTERLTVVNPIKIISAIPIKYVDSIQKNISSLEIIHNLTVGYDVEDNKGAPMGIFQPTRQIIRTRKASFITFSTSLINNGFIEIIPKKEGEFYMIPKEWIIEKEKEKYISSMMC